MASVTVSAARRRLTPVTEGPPRKRGDGNRQDNCVHHSNHVEGALAREASEVPAPLQDVHAQVWRVRHLQEGTMRVRWNLVQGRQTVVVPLAGRWNV